MFDWTWKGWLALWGTLNYWSIVPIIIIIVLGTQGWKKATIPKEEHIRDAYNQKKENERNSISKMNRIVNVLIKYSLWFMTSTFFCIAIFKMFS